MKTLIKLLLALCTLSSLAAATQGTWTTYITQSIVTISTANQTMTISPTVSLTGNDGDFCDPTQGCNGREQASVMLNGSSWVGGEILNTGYPYGNDGLTVVNTFPNVTIAAGAEADLSYAGTVVGSEQINTRDAWTTPIELPFFDDDFVDGTDPTTSPGPCYIDSFYGTPGCPSTWPSNWEPQLGWTHYNLDSQQYAWPVRTAVTWANLNCGGTQSNPTACSISNPGTNSLHCAYQNGVYACAYPLLLACSNVTPATALYVPSDPDESPGVVWFANPNNLYYSLDYGWLMITSCTQPNGKGTAWSCINPPPAAADGSTGIVASITMEPISTCTPYPTSGT